MYSPHHLTTAHTPLLGDFTPPPPPGCKHVDMTTIITRAWGCLVHNQGSTNLEEWRKGGNEGREGGSVCSKPWIHESVRFKCAKNEGRTVMWISLRYNPACDSLEMGFHNFKNKWELEWVMFVNTYLFVFPNTFSIKVENKFLRHSCLVILPSSFFVYICSILRWRLLEQNWKVARGYSLSGTQVEKNRVLARISNIT